MGAPVATLSGDFEITTAGGVAELQKLGGAMDQTTDKVVSQAGKIEKAVAQAIDPTAAVAGLRQLSAAATDTSAAAVREFNRIERAGESLSASLDRQISTFGKTTQEIRQMKVEAAALAAQQQNQTELAERLRAKEADLYALELTAARQARMEAEALAQARQQSQAASSADRTVAGLQQQIDLYGKTTAQVRAMRVEEEALAAEQAGLPQKAALIRGAYQQLIAVEAEHGGKLALNSTQLMIAEGATHRFVDSLLAGMSPMRAFMMQAGDVGNILAMDNGGVAGGLSKVKALINPVTIGIAGITAVVAVGAAAWLSYSNALDKFEQIAHGSGAMIGATGSDLESVAERASAASHLTVSAARDIETAYVQTGKIGLTILPGLTAATEDFAKGTGQALDQAKAQLATAFADPAKGADELTAKYGLLSAASLGRVHDLVDEGRETEAQGVLLKALEARFDGAAEHANILAQAWHGIENAAAGAWNWMGKAIDKAMGGGTALEKIADLRQEKAELQGRFGAGIDTSGLDQQIAALQSQLAQAKAQVSSARAHSDAVAGMRIVDQFTGDSQLGGLQGNLTAINKLLADNGKAAGLSASQMASARQAQDAYNHAINTYIPAGQKQAQIDALDAQIAAARTPAQKAALTTARERVQLAGQVITTANAEAEAHSKGAAALATASKSGQGHIDMLAREAKAMEVSIAGAYRLADAYGKSGAAALIEEATTKATTNAIKNRADQAAAVERQIRLAIAQRVADAERSTASLNDQAKVQESVNASVAAGPIPQARAADAVRDQLQLLPLLAAQQAAVHTHDIKGIQETTRALADLKAAQDRTNVDAVTTRFQADDHANDNQIAFLQRELQLVGAIDEVRVHDLAVLKATQEAADMQLNAADTASYVASHVKIADLGFTIGRQTQDLNDQLSFTADIWSEIARNAENAANGMADAFGHVGKAIGDLGAVYANYQATTAKLDADHAAALKKAGTDQGALDRANAKFAVQTATSQIGLYGDMTDAAKGFFKEGSRGYKALQTAEEVFRAVEFALSIKSMVQDAVETGSSVANAGARASADGVAAMAKTAASSPFPFNLAGMAIMAAALASVGVATGFFGGGGGSNPLPKANAGTGTILGDTTAESDSIKRALETLNDVDTSIMGYSRQMATSLKSIETELGGVASLLVRSGDIAGASAGVQTGFKTSTTGNLLSGVLEPLQAVPIIGTLAGAIGGVIKSLFGTKTSVIGSGLYGGSQSLSDIMSGGFSLQTYADIEKKKKFLGLTTGTSYSTQYGSADAGLGQQFALVLKGFDDAITAAAGPLGLATDDVTKRLDSFVVSIGKIDFTGLSGDDIQKKLEAVFGAAADNMAEAAAPGLAKFQQVGEGYFETLVRVASTIEQVDGDFKLLGLSVANLGIDAKMGVAGAFDSVGDLNSAVGTFFEDFYTDAEQTAAKTAQLQDAFKSLGVAMPTSIAGFRQLVEAQDLSTAAGQQMFGVLLQIAPAFADIATAGKNATNAAAILREGQDLQKQLLEAQGNTAAVRAMQLAALDPSNRATQQAIFDLQDAQAAQAAAEQAAQEAAQAAQQQAQAAAQAADQLRQAWKSVGDSILDEVNTIRGAMVTGPQSYASLLSQFNVATTQARGGDQDAAKALPGLAKSMLDAAAQAATSQQELLRVQGTTAASLQDTYDLINKLSGNASAPVGDGFGTANTGATEAQASWFAAFQANASGVKVAANDDDILAELKSLRAAIEKMQADQPALLAQLASPLNRMDKNIDKVVSNGGGNAFAVAVDPDEPLAVAVIGTVKTQAA